MRRKRKKTKTFRQLQFRGSTRRGVGGDLKFADGDGNFTKIKNGRQYLNVLEKLVNRDLEVA